MYTILSCTLRKVKLPIIITMCRELGEESTQHNSYSLIFGTQCVPEILTSHLLHILYITLAPNCITCNTKNITVN